VYWGASILLSFCDRYKSWSIKEIDLPTCIKELSIMDMGSTRIQDALNTIKVVERNVHLSWTITYIKMKSDTWILDKMIYIMAKFQEIWSDFLALILHQN